MAEEAADIANGKTNNMQEDVPVDEKMQELTQTPDLSERRKALFEPLEPSENVRGRRQSAESLLPPPDFDSACYPKGWLIGKKRKLVNVDVVESMRRIAVQEMNRKVLPYPDIYMVDLQIYYTSFQHSSVLGYYWHCLKVLPTINTWRISELTVILSGVVNQLELVEY